MAIPNPELLITEDMTIVSKPRTTRVEVRRLFDDETFEYDENVSVSVWTEYDFLDMDTGHLLKDVQWYEYVIEGGSDIPQNVVLYHEARIGAAIYALGVNGKDAFWPTAPSLPTEPA